MEGKKKRKNKKTFPRTEKRDFIEMIKKKEERKRRKEKKQRRRDDNKILGYENLLYILGYAFVSKLTR